MENYRPQLYLRRSWSGADVCCLPHLRLANTTGGFSGGIERRQYRRINIHSSDLRLDRFDRWRGTEMKKLLTKSTLVLAVFFSIALTSTALAETVTDRYDDTFRKYSQRFFGPG